MSPLDLELQLRQHGSALRSLARDLVRDPHKADDLVQATLQCALDKPPRRPGPIGGWLTTVLRRLHLQGRRQDQRRAARERQVAQPEQVLSTADQYERKETLRQVTAAVFTLDEPYQTTLLLRYFEDLSPTDIAVRTKTSVATVKSRLQRGLLLLKARLDASLGDRDRWTRALCAATGLRLLTTTTILTTGALLMGPTTKIALGGVAALAVGAIVWTLLDNQPTPAQPAAPVAQSPVTATAAVSDLDAKGEAVDRVAVPDALPTDDALLHPFAYDLEVLVQDRLGLPVEGAKVLLAPLGCTLDEVPDRTDGNGVVHVHWRGRAASMPVVVSTSGDEAQNSMRQLTVASGAPVRVVLGGGGARKSRFRIVNGGDGGNLTLGFSGQGISSHGGTIKLEGLVLSLDSFADNPRMRAGLHPFASFGDVQLKPPEAGAEVSALTLVGGQNVSFTISGLSLDTDHGDQAPGLAPLPTKLEGIVYGEDGKPCAKCPVAWGTTQDHASDRTETDERGAFHFDNIPAGKLELRAGGNDAGLAHMTVAVMQGQTSTAEVQLRTEITVRGHALDADGKPLGGWRVEWVGTQTPWFDACTVADDGSFTLPNLPGGAGQLQLWHKDSDIRLPLAALGNVLPDNGDTELRFDAGTGVGRLQLEPLLPDGVDKGAVEVRLFQEDSGRGTTMPKLKKSNVFALGNLAAGWYRLEVGGPGLGWLDAGRHYVEGKGLVDLGRLPLGLASQVHLRFPAGTHFSSGDDKTGTALEIYRQRADCDVRIEEVEAGFRDPLPLPPGNYFAMWRSPTGAKGFTPFTVQAGRDTAVRCMDRDVQAWDAEASGPARERR